MVIDVTVIVATYNRPDALMASLGSVLQQTYRHWRVIVIGDACAGETKAAIDKLGHQKIQFINLKQRFGEQSGPNSIGTVLANTKYIAYLNHDDFWLPDHLSTAIDTIERDETEMYTATAVAAVNDPDRPERFIFRDASPIGRRLKDAFFAPHFLFEPTSGWVMTRETAGRVGNWRSAAEIFRTPMEDWLLRAWRSDVRHSDGSRITVIKNEVKNDPNSTRPDYHIESPILGSWLDLVRTGNVEQLRSNIEADLKESERRGIERDYFNPIGIGGLSLLFGKALRPIGSAIYHKFGFDFVSAGYRLAGRKRGWRFEILLRRRTGEKFWNPPDFKVLLQQASDEFQTVVSDQE